MKGWKNGVFFLLMLLLLGWTGYTILKDQSPQQIAQAIASANLPILLLGIPVMGLYIAFEAKSSHWILRSLGSAQPYRRCYFYSCVGFFFSVITPSASGGQPAQVYYMSRDGVPGAYGALDMLLVTVGYHAAVVIYGVIALLTSHHLSQQLGEIGPLLVIGLSLFILLGVAMLLLLFAPGPIQRLCHGVIRLTARLRPSLDVPKWTQRVDRYMAQYRTGSDLLRAAPALFPKVLLMSLGQQACVYLAPYLVYLAFGLEGSTLWQVFFLQVLCSISVEYLPLPGGAGAAEQVFLHSFLVLFGATLVAPAMIVSRTVSCYLPLGITGVITALGHMVGKHSLKARPLSNAPGDLAA